MFVQSKELTHIAAPTERIVAVIESINSPNVVIPGYDAEPSRAYIVGVRNADGSFTIYIYLHQVQSNRPAIYVCDPGNVALGQYPEVEGEAIQFVESMGFMLDNLNFRRLQPSQQAAVMARLPVFHADLSPFAPEGSEPVEASAAPAAPEPEPVPNVPKNPEPTSTALLDGLETLEPLETLDALEPLDGSGGGDEILPVATVEHSGLLKLDDAEMAEISSFAEPGAAGVTLDDDERRRLVRLLISF